MNAFEGQQDFATRGDDVTRALRFCQCVLLLVLLSATQAAALTATQTGKYPTDPVVVDSYWGSGVAIEGSVAAVTEPLWRNAVVLRQEAGEWTPAVLTDTHPGQGRSVAVENGRVFVANREEGTIDIFESQAEGFVKTDALPDIVNMTSQACLLAADGALVVFSQAGSLSLPSISRLTESGWVPELLPGGAGGLSVVGLALSNERLVVALGNLGSAQMLTTYDYEGGAWVEREPLLGSFGTSVIGVAPVGLEGDALAVADATGFVRTYTWTGDGWTADSVLPGHHSAGARVHAISIDGDVLAAGVPNDFSSGFGAGSVSLYRRVGGEWTYDTTIQTPSPWRDDVAGNLRGPAFGSAVAVSGSRMVVGAFQEVTEDQLWSGAAYLYELSDETSGAAEVPVGTDVTHTDPDTGVRVRFDEVLTPGTVVVRSVPAPARGPAGRNVVDGTCYDVSFSGTRTGLAHVTIPYGSRALPEGALGMLHWTGSGWEELPVVIDETANTVTGSSDDMSPFALSGPGDEEVPVAPWPVAAALALGLAVNAWRRRS